ncbi:hypothetical protein ACJ41O_008733 [Fusarium nematophilum]
MHPRFGWPLLGLAALAKVTLGQALADVEFANLPSCASKCLLAAIADSDCPPTNKTCLCSTASLRPQAIACISDSCTVKQQLFSRNATEAGCGSPIRDKSADYAPLHISLAALSGIFILQRFSFKAWVGLRAELDDWFALLTFLATIPTTILAVYLLPSTGLGRDVWTVPFDQVTEFGRLFYMSSLLYTAQVALLKFSLLFFYFRIFPSNHVRRLLLATAVFNGACGLLYLFLIAFQCKPVDLAWRRWYGEKTGSCLSRPALAWSQSGISIALDFWMLAIPLSQIRSLHLDWKKRVGAALMFVFGSFVTAMSIVRLKSLRQFEPKVQNPTWEYLDTVNWSTAEIQVGIICTCLPVSRLLLVHLFPSVFGTSAQGNSDGHSKHHADRWNPNTNKSSYSRHSISLNAPRPGSDGSKLAYSTEGMDNDEIELVRVGDDTEAGSRSGLSI